MAGRESGLTSGKVLRAEMGVCSEMLGRLELVVRVDGLGFALRGGGGFGRSFVLFTGTWAGRLGIHGCARGRRESERWMISMGR